MHAPPRAAASWQRGAEVQIESLAGGAERFLARRPRFIRGRAINEEERAAEPATFH